MIAAQYTDCNGAAPAGMIDPVVLYAGLLNLLVCVSPRLSPDVQSRLTAEAMTWPTSKAQSIPGGQMKFKFTSLSICFQSAVQAISSVHGSSAQVRANKFRACYGLHAPHLSLYLHL